jgi:hypothetical protein
MGFTYVLKEQGSCLDVYEGLPSAYEYLSTVVENCQQVVWVGCYDGFGGHKYAKQTEKWR